MVWSASTRLVDGGIKTRSRVLVPRDGDGEKREINRTARTKSNERVVSGYFVNVLEVQEALSGRRWTKCLFAWPAGLASPAGRFGISFFAPFISLVERICEYLSPFALSPRARRPCAVVLQQNTPLIRHSAAGNYLHLFKLLFMPFV